MSTDVLDRAFAALADPTRRAILERLASEGRAVGVMELAAPFALSLPAVSKHLNVLEKGGLISKGREAQWRPCRLETKKLTEVAGWIQHYSDLWEQRFERLDSVLQQLQKPNDSKERSPTNGNEEQH